MKLIIIEGIDRAGKDSVIEKLGVNKNPYSVMRHFLAPIGENKDDKRLYAMHEIAKEMSLSENNRNKEIFNQSIGNFPEPFWVWNRGHLGEYVYGQLYRELTFDDVAYIWDLENLYGFDYKNDIYLIMMYASNVDFICKNDDGNSLSSDVNMKIKEIKYFSEAYKLSNIKNKIAVNVTNENGYRDKDEIFNEISEFLFKEK